MYASHLTAFCTQDSAPHLQVIAADAWYSLWSASVTLHDIYKPAFLLLFLFFCLFVFVFLGRCGSLIVHEH